MNNLEKQIEALLDTIISDNNFALLSEGKILLRIRDDLLISLLDKVKNNGPEALAMAIELSASCLFLLAKKRIEDRTSRSSFAE